MANEPNPASGEERYPSGTLLCMDDEQLYVYRRPVSGQPYDMVYVLQPDGSVKIEAVEFGTHKINILGHLNSDDVRQLQNSMRWTKELLKGGCINPEDADQLPDPDPSATSESAGPAAPKIEDFKVEDYKGKKSAALPIQDQAASVKDPQKIESAGIEGSEEHTGRVTSGQGAQKQKLRRGQSVTLTFGGKTWQAIYWGRDQQGSVVAHNTNKKWSLMHLDLTQYRDSLVIGAEPDPGLIEEILTDLSTNADA